MPSNKCVACRRRMVVNPTTKTSLKRSEVDHGEDLCAECHTADRCKERCFWIHVDPYARANQVLEMGSDGEEICLLCLWQPKTKNDLNGSYCQKCMRKWVGLLMSRRFGPWANVIADLVGRPRTRKRNRENRAKRLGPGGQAKALEYTAKWIDWQDDQCFLCGNTEQLELDHIKELQDGGEHSLSNTWILCKECHKRKTRKRTPGGLRVALERRRRALADDPDFSQNL